MPLGNGDIGVNAWVEEDGDLLFYIGKTDSWDDNGRLLKVGRVRIHIDPRPEVPLRGFRQALDLEEGSMAARFGDGGNAIEIRMWVDANHPSVNVDIDSKREISATASIEMWRTHKDTLTGIEVSDVFCDAAEVKRGETVVEPDSLLLTEDARIGWYHHNIKSVGPEISARLQGLQAFQRPDPLLHRTFGGVITASEPSRIDACHLLSRPSRHHEFSVYVATRHPALPNDWLRGIQDLIGETEKVPRAIREETHRKWWGDFWDRSWIHVTRSEAHPADSLDAAFLVSQSYALQRYIAACAGRGQYPIKFNGSLFTVPWAGKPGDADYRRWGPGYWWQNTRLPYVSMCASGDTDLMRPLFKMYAQDLMPLFRYRTRHYLNHDGAFIPECIMFWGDMFNETYGWTPFEERTDKLQENRYHKWEWVSGLELVGLMLDFYEHTLDSLFFKEQILPTAHEILTFFDEHYAVDDHGKLLMSPSQACETWWECTNPMPEIAGLHAVISRLLIYKRYLAPSEERMLQALKRKTPDLPLRTVDGRPMLAAADAFARKMNIENPELYAVFPFRLVALEKPNRALGIAALNQREDRGNFGWRQDDIFMAYLGLADSARQYLVGRARNTNSDSRFPAFWGPNYDWVPDQDHGSVLLKTLQAMLLQTDGEKCILLPAWPSNWNVQFKLHAPFCTTIEGEVRDGKLEWLSTSPRERREDIVVMDPQ
jgi:alpha-L-fucosidase 2